MLKVCCQHSGELAWASLPHGSNPIKRNMFAEENKPLPAWPSAGQDTPAGAGATHRIQRERNGETERERDGEREEGRGRKKEIGFDV